MSFFFGFGIKEGIKELQRRLDDIKHTNFSLFSLLFPQNTVLGKKKKKKEEEKKKKKKRRKKERKKKEKREIMIVIDNNKNRFCTFSFSLSLFSR
jgi:hypothetical protein